MSAVMETREHSAKYLSDLQPPLVQHFELMATAQGGVAKLRELILTLAVQGKLVPQDPRDEPASQLLKRVTSEKDRLISAKTIKREKPLVEIGEEDQPFPLPIGWEWVRLAEIAHPQAGFAFKSTGFNEVGQGVPLIRIRDVGDNNPSTYFSGDYRDEFVVDSGDWLISMDGEFRVREWCGPRALLNQRVTRLVFYGEELYRPFVSAALQFKLTELQGTKAYTTVDHLSGGQIAFAVMALPPLAEQSRIVTRVEELMRLCDALEAKDQLEAAQHAQLVQTLLGALTASVTPEDLADNWERVAAHFDLLLDRPEAIDALEQTILQLAVRGLLVPQDPKDEPASELLKKIRAEKDRLIAEGKIKRDKPMEPVAIEDVPFVLPIGWTWVRFDELIHPLKPIAYGVLVPGPDVEAGVPFVRIADLSIDNPAPMPEKSIGRDIDSQFQRTRLEGGEILMGVVGSIGKLGVAPATWAGANIARAICRIVPADAGLKEFVLFLLQTEFMQQSFVGDTRTLAQPTLNVGLIRQALTPVPPPAEQARIVACVSLLRRHCADLRQRLTARQTTQAHLAEALIDEVA
ncbi:MAG: restriction endonuclease subunit S [Hydrogenophaga sp.]|nr:restriction endonuclease subunit S [Hydrogenophaga sp.]